MFFLLVAQVARLIRSLVTMFLCLFSEILLSSLLKRQRFKFCNLRTLLLFYRETNLILLILVHTFILIATKLFKKSVTFKLFSNV